MVGHLRNCHYQEGIVGLDPLHTGLLDHQNLADSRYGWSNLEFVLFSLIISSKTWNIAIKWSEDTSGITLKIIKKCRGRCCCQISKQSVSPLVSGLGGQVGHQKKQNSLRNWLFIVLCATFQPKLSNLAKFWTFLKIVQFWLKSSARNQEKSIPWRISLLLMPHLTPKSRD